MNYKETLDYINNFTWSTTRLGLDRTRELLGRLGNPQKKLKFVHVAGTNGKGSTCAMLAAILTASGLRTGLYPSPYIENFRERIETDGEMISEAELCLLTETVRKEADAMEDHPSQFELITAIGMLYFLEKRCDIVVLEVGMGGMLDSTNVIDAPEAAVITNIGLDHTEYLGNTIEKIAEAKAGIIKPGSDVIVYDNMPEVINVISSKCREKGDRLYLTDGLVKAGSHSLDGQEFAYRSEKDKEYKKYFLSLLGEHQIKNAAVVLKTIEVLRNRGFNISETAVRKGLRDVSWPARFEVLSRKPLFILDGGHNPQCAEALARNIEEYIINGRTDAAICNEYEKGRDNFTELTGGKSKADKGKAANGSGTSVTFLIGMLADKDYRKTLELLKPYGRNYVCITPESPRALRAEALAEEIRKVSGKDTIAKAEENIKSAIIKALSFGLPVVAFGSLYSAGAIRKAYREILSAKP